MTKEALKNWFKIIKQDVHMMKGNVDNPEKFDEMMRNACCNLEYLEITLIKDFNL